jgi:hypothetical protein
MDSKSSQDIDSKANTKLFKIMKKMEKKLNGEIGFHWWKRYIAAAVWDNMATPINLAITLLTAIISAQANTDNLISKNLNSTITIITLFLSTINTFFRPHTKKSINIELMNKYNEFGNTFEEIYYSPCIIDNDFIRRNDAYIKLQNEMNKFETNQSPEARNFFTDFIYIICRLTCLKGNNKWLDLDKEFIGE